MSSTYGKNIKISIFGQSHSKAIGVTIDGIPAGSKFDMKQLGDFMERRAPGRNKYSTQRNEPDKVEFLCGVINDTTCGTPITAIIENRNAKSQDYTEIADIPRPGHGDYTGHVKYRGFEDVAGGGHFSGRLTAPLCIAGGLCKQLLSNSNVEINSKAIEIGGETESKKMMDAIDGARQAGDSVGGIIECNITGLKAGIGDPMFEGIENKISQAIFSIPAIKGIEFGRGFESARLKGSENNDEFYYDGNVIKTRSNNHGGILGGISSGMPIVFRVAVKPTPSISMLQNSVSYSKQENVELQIKGRHDPCIVLRAIPCVEAVAAIVIYDILRGTIGENI